MSQKWTKGSWIFIPEVGQVLAFEETIRAILDIDSSGSIDNDEERDANGYLIAAAPELYALLSETRGYVQGDASLLTLIDTALAKSRGER